MSVFGLPFFLAGVFQLLSAVRLTPMTDAGPTSRIVLALMGAVFTGVGGVLVFGRRWTTIDRVRRVVLKERGLVVPMQRTAHPLADDGLVILGFEEGDSDTADRFPVSLRSSSQPLITLCRFTQYAESRACAAEVAQYLRIGIEDRTTDHVARLPADHADLPLRDRLRLGRVLDDTVRPPSMQSEITQDPDGVRIVMPLEGIHPAMLAASFLPLLIGSFVFWPLVRFFRETNTPGPFAALFLGALIFMFVGLPVGGALKSVLRSWLGRSIVIVSPHGLRIAERHVYGTREITSLAASEIMDVDFSTTSSLVAFTMRAIEEKLEQSGQGTAALGRGPGRVIAAITRYTKSNGVIVKTRHGLTRVAQGLPDDEIQYLHLVIRRALAGDPFNSF